MSSSKVENRFERQQGNSEKERIRSLVFQLTSDVNGIGVVVAGKIWDHPPSLINPIVDLKLLTEDQVIVEESERFAAIFGEQHQKAAGVYVINKDLVGINLDMLCKKIETTEKVLELWHLQDLVDAESLVAFYLLAHEGVVHRWCLEKEIFDEKSLYVLKAIAKNRIASDGSESFRGWDWDRVKISTRGCEVFYRHPGCEEVAVIGRRINEAYTSVLASDLIYSYLTTYSRFQMMDRTKIALMPIVGRSIWKHLESVYLFEEVVGRGRLAYYYFSGRIYDELPRDMGVLERGTLFSYLFEGRSREFFNAYLGNLDAARRGSF